MGYSWDDFTGDVKGAGQWVNGGWLEDVKPFGERGGDAPPVNANNYNLPGIGSAGQTNQSMWGVNVPSNTASGYEQHQDRYSSYLDAIQGRDAPQIGEFQNVQQSQVAGQQQSLADMLAARARGENSVAELQLRQAADQGMNQQRSMAMGARPGQSAMAARLASQNMGRMQAGLGQSAAIARAQEAQMAAQGLGGLLGQMRGSDDQTGMFNANQQNNRTGQQAQMNQQQMGMNDAANNALLGGSLNAAGMQQQGGIAQEQNNTNRWGVQMGVPTQQEQFMGGVAGAAPMLLSDERAKTGIRPGDGSADNFLSSLAPQQFSYKPSGLLPGELAKSAGSEGGQQLGVMAQDVASTPGGAQGVQQTPGGMLGLDSTKMQGPVLAGLGRLHERLTQLERTRGR